MTVAEIQELINACLQKPQNEYMREKRVLRLENCLEQVKSMLDELEPKENNK